jgi:hypothetical protein
LVASSIIKENLSLLKRNNTQIEYPTGHCSGMGLKTNSYAIRASDKLVGKWISLEIKLAGPIIP